MKANRVRMGVLVAVLSQRPVNSKFSLVNGHAVHKNVFTKIKNENWEIKGKERGKETVHFRTAANCQSEQMTSLILAV